MFKSLRSIYCVLALLLNFTIVGMVFAADDDREAIAVPANTQETQAQTRVIAGSNYETVYYESNLNPDQLRNFYRKTLDDREWSSTQEDPAVVLKQLRGLKLKVDESAIKQSLKDNLEFEKDGEILSINIIPAEISSTKKVSYTITRGKPDLSAQSAGGDDFIPRLLSRPKQEPAPVYPQASLVSFSEGDNFLKANYATKDDLEDVIGFYRDNMASYGWSLKEDNPANVVESATEEDINTYCPECAKNGIKTAAPDMQIKQFMFTNDRQAKCGISLFQVKIPAQGQAGEMNFTNITVDYEKRQ